MKIKKVLFKAVAAAFTSLIMLSGCEEPKADLDSATTLAELVVTDASGSTTVKSFTAKNLTAKSLSAKPVNRIESVKVTPISADDVAQTISYSYTNDNDENVEDSIDSGSSFNVDDLVEGSAKKVYITVSEDGKDDFSYTLKITRQKTTPDSTVVTLKTFYTFEEFSNITDESELANAEADNYKMAKLVLTSGEWVQDDINNASPKNWFTYDEPDESKKTELGVESGTTLTDPGNVSVEIDTNDSSVLIITFNGNTDTCFKIAKIDPNQLEEIADTTNKQTVTNNPTESVTIFLGTLPSSAP